MVVVLILERRQVLLGVATGLLEVAQLLSGRAIVGLVLSTNPQPLGSERIQNKMNGFSQSEKNTTTKNDNSYSLLSVRVSLVLCNLIYSTV